jgi:acetylornithine/succinyldiaminopimelate/putrescine aminotransferase
VSEGGSGAIVEREARYAIPTYSQIPVAIVRGEGVRVTDADGATWLDFYGGHAVALTGHCHPRLVAALREQAGRLLFYSNVAPNDVRAQAYRDLADTAPDGLSRVFFCNSGAEANEAAIKLARRTTGRREVISMEGGFHGRTMGALSATALGHYLEDYAPGVPGHRVIPFADLDAARAAVTDATAAVLLEPIQSMGGVKVAPDAYLSGLRELCDERGACLIFDEVQTGPARTGTWWYGEHAGVTPDLITSAKGLGSGVPVGAVIASDAIGGQVRHGDQGTTFGGGMLAAVAVSATIGIVRDEDLLGNAARREAQIREALAPLDGVREVRGRGLLLGIVLDRAARDVVAALRERRVLAGVTPGDPHVLRLLPPLTITEGDVDEFVAALADALATG